MERFAALQVSASGIQTQGALPWKARERSAMPSGSSDREQLTAVYCACCAVEIQFPAWKLTLTLNLKSFKAPEQ